LIRYFLGLGSNLGDKEDNLRLALDALKKSRIKVLDASSVYHTQPVGDTDQPWFCNQVIEVETGLTPHRLLALTQKLERRLGRRPGRSLGPRTIDIDILLAGELVIASAKLAVPHPRMAERNFVLVPLREIAPRAVHPILGVDIEELASRSADRSIVRKARVRRTAGGGVRKTKAPRAGRRRQGS
jgi:2-amino-4-hydroxy-6-hydroxymethyldihydropteridine diphosphokinase